MSRALMLLLLVVATACAGTADGARSAVSRAEADAWLRWTLPLPKQIAIAEKVTLHPSEVGVRLRREAGPAEETAAAQLEALFVERAGVEPRGNGFRIVIGVCDEAGSVRGREGVIDPARLRRLPNAEQAYAIVPWREDELVLTALGEAGVYYAVQTLRQLLEATLSEESVEIPIVEVLDWPDLEERGEWGGSVVRDIEWMAAHKMNLIESHMQAKVLEDGSVEVSMANAEMFRRGRDNALNAAPIITHLDHLLGVGAYAVYPQLIGQGYDLNNPVSGSLIAPCASQPEFIDLLAEWMDTLSSIEGVTDISVWLSECRVQCECADCQEYGQYALEAKSIVEAFRRNQPKHPEIDMRILLTQGSYDTNAEVLAEIPPEVGVTYYDGGRTYDSSREEMIYPLLEEFAAGGGWLGCYPQLTAAWRIVCPWTGPQFIHYRVNEFVDDGLQCLCGYATPDNRCYEFNVLAAAEWSWNAKGRSPREFAAAWATRTGLAEPDAVAEWALRMGDVGWNIHGARVLWPAFFGRAAGYVKSGSAPAFGKDMYRYYASPAALDEDIATATWAIGEARRLEAPTLVAEAEVVQGVLRMMRGIHDMAALIAAAEGAPEDMRAALNAEMHGMALASQQARLAMLDWRDSLEGWSGAARLDDTIEAIDGTASQIGEHLAKYGIADPGKPYRQTTIGTWTADDFEDGRRVEKQFEVTELIDAPGTYSVGFRYTDGWHGLVSHRVALLAAPKGNPEDAVEVGADEHRGVAAHRNENNIYTLEAPEVDPEMVYFVRVDIEGTPNSGQAAGRTGCSGNVWMIRAGQLDANAGPPELPPLTTEQAAAFGPPQFQTDRPHVGVLPAGYGAAGIRSYLATQGGLEVLPLARIGADMLAPCDAVVIPQPKIVSVVGDAAVAALRDYVAAGGGLVVTHDAVGFRGLPAVIPEVCDGGIDKTPQTEWLAIAEHPVTAGIALDVPHPQGYYDQIQLRPGPDGQVLARSAGDENAVVIAGEFGEGRYVAIGLAVGLNADTEDAEPEGAEAQLLLGAVTWAAG